MSAGITKQVQFEMYGRHRTPKVSTAEQVEKVKGAQQPAQLIPDSPGKKVKSKCSVRQSV